MTIFIYGWVRVNEILATGKPLVRALDGSAAETCVEQISEVGPEFTKVNFHLSIPGVLAYVYWLGRHISLHPCR